MGRKPVDLYVRDGHVDIGGKYRQQKQGQPPAGHELDAAPGYQESRSAQQLENAADEDAQPVKGNPGRHDRKEERRVPQMNRPRGQKKCGQKKTHRHAKNSEPTRHP
jgi:hypothetical protein